MRWLLDRWVFPWWDALDDAGKRQATVALIGVGLFLLHYGFYSLWLIEDAAISFAFARHFAHGDGWVAFVGGEPVQGFSNPTWTLLLALGVLVGVSPFVFAKLLGAVFGAAGIALAWQWGRATLPDRADLVPALPAVVLACSPYYVGWAASGLENSLVNLLVGAGAVLLLAELRRPPRVPWSALIWSVLAISRPEGPGYAAIAAAIGLIAALSLHGPRVALGQAWRWALLAAAPFAAWHAYALAVFAWEAPMTYYAKLGSDSSFEPFQWSGKGSRGWRYLRAFALRSGHGFVLWLYGLGMVGVRGWRLAVAVPVLVVVHLALVPGLDWLASWIGEAPLSAVSAAPFWPFVPEGEALVVIRVALLGAAFVLLPVLGVGRRGQTSRVLAAGVIGFSVFFALYSGGDWMKGFRWLSPASLPLSVLLVDAAATLADRLGAAGRRVWARRVVLGLPVAGLAIASVAQSVVIIGWPETSPFDVSRRVFYILGAADRLDLDRPVLLDADMGAHVWWAGERAEIVDMVGLVDVPLGVHHWEKPFIAEYIYDERRPDFAHVHGGWARKTGMRSHGAWRDYLEIPPYPVSRRRVHLGNHVRRDLLIDPDPPSDPGRRVRFDNDVELVGWELPAAAVPAGGSLRVELTWARAGKPIDGLAQAIVFVAGQGRLVAAELRPLHGWLPYRSWRLDEPMRSVHDLPLPDDLPLGRYDLGILVLDGRGRIRTAQLLPPGVVQGEPVYARSELRWPGQVRVVDRAHAVVSLQRAELEATGDGPCDDRSARWRAARHHLGSDDPERVRARAHVAEALAACYADRARLAAESGSPRGEIVQAFRAGRVHQPRSPSLIGVGRAIAPHWFAASRDREAAGDLDEAYYLARDGLILDPTAAWERRRAERLRDVRLDLPLRTTWLGRWIAP